jgi:serine/threonine protein phosphatase 1
MRRFAISDIHGCLRTFESLLECLSLEKEDQLFLLGDYIDRGPDSKGVIDCIIALRERGQQVFCLRGNHEQMLLNAIANPRHLPVFLSNGGVESLLSFGTTNPRDIPEPYLRFINDLPLYLEIPDYVLVHAGLNFNLQDPLQGENEMIWIRNWYSSIQYEWLGPRLIVHGHTPIGKSAITAMARQLPLRRVLNIDAGCVYSYDTSMGALCAFDLDTGKLFFQDNIEVA